MPTQVAPLGLRLFLEGVEVPVISAQVSVQPGVPASAAIQVVPSDGALLLMPRTLVHLFYLDNQFLDSTTPSLLTSTARNAKGQPLRAQDDQNRFTVADEQYKLLFSGEVVGYNYQKSSTGRAMILQCLDFSSYWDTCYQWFAEFAVGGDGLTDKHHNFVGAGQYVFNDVAAGTRWVIGKILNAKPVNPAYKDTEGLLAGYIHLLEVISGIRPSAIRNDKPKYRAFRGVNDFFTIAELMYNLTGMLGAVQSDKTSAKMFAHKAFRNWLRNGMASAGSLVSFRDTLGIVGQYIFHDVYPNPAPFYVPPGTTTTRVVSRTTTETLVGRDIIAEIEEVKSKVQGVRDELNSGANPVHVAVSKSTQVLGDVDVTLQDISRSILGSTGSDRSTLDTYVRLARAAVRHVRSQFRQGGGVVYSNEAFLVGQAVAQVLYGNLGEVIDNLDQVIAGSAVTTTSSEEQEITIGEHLYNELLLPETFFVAPPKCNVLFPDMYSDFSFSRNFMREVSRLACQGGLGMIAQGSGSKILGRHYFAPNIKDARGKVYRKTVFSQGTILLPHEVHSGIIPKLEWVTDGHRWGVNAAKGRGRLTLGKKVSYIQRLANYQFFMHRWAARQMATVGRFNPHMVIGFPGVVVDRTTPNLGSVRAGSRLRVASSMLPTAYVGKVGSLQHSVSQDGGETSVTWGMCRTHKGADDEFLGVLRRESIEETKEVVTILTQETINTLQAGLVPDDRHLLFMQLWIKGTLVPNAETGAGVISQVLGGDTPDLEVTREEARLFGVTDDDVTTLRSRQASRADILENPQNVLLPASLQVEVIVRAREGQAIPVEEGGPFEEVVRPGWYSPEVWDNDNISDKVYGPLLGTSAITDDTTASDPEQVNALINSALFGFDTGDESTVLEQVGDSTFVVRLNGEIVASLHFNTTGAGSVEVAIDSLTLLYGIMKKNGLDVQPFIDAYTKRPIANMIEVLGDSDFQLDNDGNPRLRGDGTQPFEGFHSRAFGPYNVNVQFRAQTGENSPPPRAGKDALRGLLPSDPTERKKFEDTGTIIRKAKDGKKTKKTIPVPEHLDPRGKAQSRVRIYVDELKYSRGILGT